MVRPVIPDLPERPRAVLDACVLYPTVMREVLLAVARAGLFAPLWSARLLEEWALAAARRGTLEEAQARGEIAATRATFPLAEAPPVQGTGERLWLPDPGDIHVLATAVATSADGIVTLNARDFPRGTLAEEGLARWDPDAFLMALWLRAPDSVAQAAESVRAEAERLDTAPAELRALLKKARLPRLAKALGG
ncbi:PIN domain-containing protein [Rhodovulum sp. 12E13]|uniref:RSP_2648 family PIN domain-containing protein n=1 Tax=Rhodovulum sp. 12E13 TaxID=2203891 RepID=UPI000E19F439|nr:PIN domain-containing protein [Rhodovulum sp. 12E13]RDC72437.1 PIN domain-containing protein [Rhodovulum sp. 12E13]